MREKTEIYSHIDHTLLGQTATLPELFRLCDEALDWGAASVCVPPCYVKNAADYLSGSVKVCTVIGFPNGYNSTEIKVKEAERAILDGACEIDMVINMGMVKDRRLREVEEEIKAVRTACRDAVLKVIVETCFLNDYEKEALCRIVDSAGADYIKTSTGFGSAGASEEDVALFAECLKDSNVRIKAAGGIRTPEAADRFLDLGADRIGSSAIIRGEYL